MSYKCPFCDEDIKFDPDHGNDGPKKCPHCHEFVRPYGLYWRFRTWVFNQIKMDGGKLKHLANFVIAFLFAALIGVIICFMTGLPEQFNISYNLILGFIAFIIALVALTRPFNIQTVVIIGFIALMFNGLGTLWQKENFDLRNRPYLGIVPLYFDMTQVYAPPTRGNAQNPSAQSTDRIFMLKVQIQNGGEIGAILEDFEYIPFAVSDNRFLDKGGEKIVAVPLKKLNEHYGVIEWKNAPILPHGAIEQDIVNSPFGISDFQKLGGDNVDVYFWLKATYRPVGEKKKFYFWTVIKSKGGSEFRFVGSGDRDRDFAKEYGI